MRATIAHLKQSLEVGDSALELSRHVFMPPLAKIVDINAVSTTTLLQSIMHKWHPVPESHTWFFAELFNGNVECLSCFCEIWEDWRVRVW
jgi:hypothetical protein